MTESGHNYGYNNYEYHGVQNNLNFKKLKNNEKCGKEKDSQNKP